MKTMSRQLFHTGGTSIFRVYVSLNRISEKNLFKINDEINIMKQHFCNVSQKAPFFSAHNAKNLYLNVNLAQEYLFVRLSTYLTCKPTTVYTQFSARNGRVLKITHQHINFWPKRYYTRHAYYVNICSRMTRLFSDISHRLSTVTILV